MTAEKQSPFLSGGPTRRDRLPVLVGPLVGVLAALVCGISVLTGVVVVHNMQQELTVARERLAVLENLQGIAGEDQAVDLSEVTAWLDKPRGSPLDAYLVHRVMPLNVFRNH